MKKVLLTGASGFLGKAIIQCFKYSRKNKLSLVYRKNVCSTESQSFSVGDFNNSTDFSVALSGQDVVIHAAARVHIMNESSCDSISKFRLVNVISTLKLARQAVEAGVKRFIFISSIKVNGETTSGSQSFSPLDTANPQDPYAISKYEAEKALIEISNNSNMEVVIIRPTLIYGPGVKGNFEKFIKIIKFGIPLPLGSVNNKRSLIALDNLVDLIITCVDHPNAANKILLVSDSEDVSTLDLAREISKAFGVRIYTFPLSVGLIKFLARIIGKGTVVDRLFCNLMVDSSKTLELLNWKPIISMKDQLKKIAEYDKLRVKK